MRLSALTYTLLSVALVAFVVGALAGTPAMIAVAAGCIAIPAVGIFTELGALKSAVSSLSFSRTVSATHLRQGSDVTVNAFLHPVCPAYQFEDIAPHGTRRVSGSAAFVDGVASYVLRVPVAGPVRFGGILVTAKTVFGTFTFRLSQADEPELTVYLSGTAALIQKNRADISEHATDTQAIISSPEIRDFREYQPGDSVRDIDWKQTLKHDDVYVRVRQNTADEGPFVVFDVPDTFVSAADVDAFTQVAQSVLTYAGTFDGTVPVAFVCGGDILAILSLAETSKVVAQLLSAGKRERNAAMYRERSKQDLVRMRELIPPSGTYSAILRGILQETAKRAEFGFEAQAKRLVASCVRSAADAIIVSPARGDISHLRYLVASSARYADTVTVYLTTDQPALIDAFMRLGATAVEVRA